MKRLSFVIPAIIIAGDSKFPQMADVTTDFVYARIMGTSEGEKNGYSPAGLDRPGLT